jgi:hypothetical protein
VLQTDLKIVEGPTTKEFIVYVYIGASRVLLVAFLVVLGGFWFSTIQFLVVLGRI